jgi:hypothetical protein
VTYEWSPTGESTQAIMPTMSGVYHVTVTDTSGCSFISPDMLVTILPLTAASAINPPSQTVPKGAAPQPLSVNAAGAGVLTYQWYAGPSGNTNTPIAGAVSATFVPPTDRKGTFSYWVRVSGTCGTADSPAAMVLVN